MQLLTDDDKALLVLEHLGPAALAGDTMSLYDCFQLALDVAEKALLAKLGAMELPEPAYFVDACELDRAEKCCRGIHCTRLQDVFTADQLRQAYAQGAAAQLAQEPEWYAYRTNGAHWFCFPHKPPEDSYDEGTLKPLYTRREA